MNRQLEIQFWQNMRKKDIHITQVLGIWIFINYTVTTAATNKQQQPFYGHFAGEPLLAGASS